MQLNDPQGKPFDTDKVFDEVQVDYIGFTLEDLGEPGNFESTMRRLQVYHKELLQHINKLYEGCKRSIDAYYKTQVTAKRDELSRIAPADEQSVTK